jgi:hypothetical protein
VAVQLSVKANALLKEISIKPNIILDIEGLDLIFGATPIFKTLNWDDENALWDSGLNWDGIIEDQRSRDYISLQGTTNTVSQQIAPDKGNTSSISTVNITIIDKDGEVSKALSFDNIDEILGRKALFSLGFQQGRYPEDAQKIFSGVVVDFYTDAGNVMVSLASSQSLQRQLFLEKHQTALTAAIDNSQTTIQVADTSQFYESQDALSLYVRIDDEIMQVDSIDSDTQLTVTRGQLNTVANPADINTECESFYRLQGKPLDLARKIMLSSAGNEYFTSLDTPKSINFVDVLTEIPNAIIFDYYDIQDKTGLTVGDTVQLNSASNTGTYTIDEFGTLESGDSYIVVNETLVTESEYTGDFLYKSKWNTLSTGLGMLTNEVDIEQFDSIASAFGSNFVDLDLYIKDSIDDAQEYLNKQVFFCQGLYPIIRKSRSSVKFVVPPFSSDIVDTIGVDSITNVGQLKQRRSAHKYLYNTYVYRYNVDSLEDKYLAGKVVLSASSINRINLGKKQLKVESDGLRNNAATNTVIDNIIQRFIDRFQFAPVYTDIEVKYKDGYKIEIGDIVPFGGKDLKIVDLSSGARGSEPKLFEVINKSLNVKTGKIKLTLLETSFEINARYATISLSSNIGNTSTALRIKIEKTNDTEEFARESDKWAPFEGLRVRIRSFDYVDDETVTLTGVDQSNSDYLLLETALSFTPTSNHVIEVPEYDNTSASIDAEYKLRFAYFNAQATITNVTDAQTFEVDDGSRLAIGSKIYVHSKDYTRDSFDADIEIANIVGNVVILNQALDFTLQVNDLLDGSDYLDGGFAYRII